MKKTDLKHTAAVILAAVILVMSGLGAYAEPVFGYSSEAGSAASAEPIFSYRSIVPVTKGRS